MFGGTHPCALSQAIHAHEETRDSGFGIGESGETQDSGHGTRDPELGIRG